MKYFKTLLIIAFNSFLVLTLNAQVSPQWVSYYNGPSNNSDIPVAMTVDNSGNIYVTGVSPMPSQNDDYLTVKYNSAGAEQWTARYHTAGSNDDVVRAIAVDNSGNVYVTGSVSYGGSNGVQITIKYNSPEWSSGSGSWVNR
ncbi:MAG: SBBP repeat-containing protein [Ignavibacteria bacterium]|nr:SBBP repeat-containing protein [Ignavibacteria bacterium]